MSAAWLILASLIYLGALFAVAYWTDRRGRSSGRAEGWIYALSIAVYCTSWTFFGSVGYAAQTGYGFLPVYLGPILVFVAAQPFLRKLLAVSKAQHITSIADLIAARYGKRQALAGLVTLIAVVGIVPYISLQLKAVSATFDILRGASGEPVPPLYADSALHVALLMSAFVIVFATRRVDATEQHRGVITAVALESVVKLVVFLAVGAFVTYGMHDGFVDLFESAEAYPELAKLIDLSQALREPSFWSITLLSALVIVCLPRQFQVTVVENTDPRHLRHAAWIFPIYLVAINLFVLPIALAGLMHTREFGGDPDTLVLTLPLGDGQHGLALLAFLGGFAAATGMIIIETIALSTMVCNDLVLPLLIRGKRLAADHRTGVVGLVKRVRRMSIVVVLLLAYAYVRLIGSSYALVSIGLVSFAAAAQFAPAIIGGLYWRRGNHAGALAGLVAGFAVWLYTLLLPSFAESGWLARDFITTGPWGFEALRPYALFGVGGLDRISHSLLWSLAANVGAYALISRLSTPDAREAEQAHAFVDVYVRSAAPAHALAPGVAWRDVGAMLERFLGRTLAQQALAEHAAARGIVFDRGRDADTEVVDFAEKRIAGAVGSSLARVVIAAALRRETVSVEGVMHLLSDASEQIEAQWERLREAVENISQGLAMFDADLKLVVWNQRFLELLDLPPSFGAYGTSFEALIRHNAARGEYGPGDIEAQVAERVALAQRFEAHRIERARPNGIILEIAGKPLPRGGFISTYTDITERRRQEEALREAKNELERRVVERTRELSESEARFRDFAESSSDWFWETDAENRFVYFSERASKILDRPAGALLGKRREELSTPGEIQREAEKWQRYAELIDAHEPIRGFEYRVLGNDGNLRTVHVSGKPIFAADGRFLGYRGTGSDVSALVRAQEELLRSEKLVALGGLVAGIAHEINTPIGIGMTAASYLEEQSRGVLAQYAAGELTRSALETYLAASGEAATSLLTNLRRAAGLVHSFKQVAVDQSSEQRRRFLLKEYLDEILASLHPKLKRTQHTVHIDCPDDLELDSYPGAYSQIVTNLVLNSLQHGFAEKAEGRIEIVARRHGGTVSLVYRDDGCGMAAAVAQRMFEPFFTTRRGQGGSGLGMHVVYNLVTQTLGGQIECDTAPGRGVTFRISAPLEPETDHERT